MKNTKIQFETDNSGKVAKLNNPAINRVIFDLYINTFCRHINNGKYDIKLSDIKYFDNHRDVNKVYRLFIKGKSIIYFDRQGHYPNPKDHLIPVVSYLNFVKETFEYASYQHGTLWQYLKARAKRQFQHFK